MMLPLAISDGAIVSLCGAAGIIFGVPSAIIGLIVLRTKTDGDEVKSLRGELRIAMQANSTVETTLGRLDERVKHLEEELKKRDALIHILENEKRTLSNDITDMRHRAHAAEMSLVQVVTEINDLLKADGKPPRYPDPKEILIRQAREAMEGPANVASSLLGSVQSHSALTNTPAT